MGLESPKLAFFEKRFSGKLFFRKNKGPKGPWGPKGPPINPFMGPKGAQGGPPLFPPLFPPYSPLLPLRDSPSGQFTLVMDWILKAWARSTS